MGVVGQQYMLRPFQRGFRKVREEEVYRGFIPEQMNRKEFKVFDMMRNRLALLPALFFNRQLFIEGTVSRSPPKFLNNGPLL